ncbi:uncharacterized protein LOC108631777 isoform X2 [Ceratina calcarata]|uniref:Uncharacterized protein LOC108631777 isoform X2 n=1 Tax=Ceratina calcarata TaxID=156304 RepID=A0AAJ7JFD4_9HYME|nr:uncharacterized protein LOC108631777 isoform X2 [Ceratina calcarata]
MMYIAMTMIHESRLQTNHYYGDLLAYLMRAVLFFVAVAATGAMPLTKVHVKFVSPPHIYEHGITTDGDRTIDQRSYVSIGRRSTTGSPRVFGQHLRNRPNTVPTYIKPENAEALWPVGVFIPPVDINDLGYSSHESRHVTPDFSNGLKYHDPYLITGRKAMQLVKYLYSRGELFYDDIPHERALLRNQEERSRNGLHGHVLSSLRRTSAFYRRN